jgi:hypothetical protein
MSDRTFTERDDIAPFHRYSAVGTDPMRARFAALQVTGAGLLIALWLSGYGATFLRADRIHAVPVIGAVILIGLIAAWRGRWQTVDWIADKLPVLGLIGTVAGIILAISDIGAENLDTQRLKIFSEIGYSLVANLLGIAGFAWLSLTQRICQP